MLTVEVPPEPGVTGFPEAGVLPGVVLEVAVAFEVGVSTWIGWGLGPQAAANKSRELLTKANK